MQRLTYLLPTLSSAHTITVDVKLAFTDAVSSVSSAHTSPAHPHIHTHAVRCGPHLCDLATVRTLICAPGGTPRAAAASTPASSAPVGGATLMRVTACAHADRAARHAA
eukprot:58073-Chlamydomonas_euryale.AAC.1